MSTEAEAKPLVKYSATPTVVIATVTVLDTPKHTGPYSRELTIARRGNELLVDGKPAVSVLFTAGPDGDELQVRRD